MSKQNHVALGDRFATMMRKGTKAISTRLRLTNQSAKARATLGGAIGPLFMKDTPGQAQLIAADDWPNWPGPARLASGLPGNHRWVLLSVALPPGVRHR